MKTIVAILAWGVAFGAPQGFERVAGEAAAPVMDSTGSWVLKSGERAIVQWDRFSVEHAEKFRFEQPSESAAILNRVVGGEMSRIFGELSSNGRVYLLNPEGVLIGPHAQVETAGFVASSHDVLDQDFIQDKQLLFADAGHGSVINFGVVHCESGDIALLARQVQNHGALEAPEGRVGLGVGAEILLQPKGLPFVWIQTPLRTGVQKDGVSIEHTGAIEALAVEMRASSNAYSMAIQSSGVIDALGVEREGGEVRLIAEQGMCAVSGSITAGEPVKGAAAKGGFIEVSGEQIQLTGPLMAQNVLLDPTDITISTGLSVNGLFNLCAFQPLAILSVINTVTLQDLLDGCNVTISTASGFLGLNGGSITVSNPLTWSAATTLTLRSDAFIVVNSPISNTSASTGFTAINLTASGSNSTAGAYAGLQINASVSASQGNISLSGQGSPAGGAGVLVAAAVSTAGSITFSNCAGGGGMGSGNHGVHINGSGSLSARQILLSGKGGSGAGGGHYGVNFAGAITLSGSSPSLQFVNCFGGSGGAQNIGVAINNSIRLTTGAITLNNVRGGSGTSDHYGLYIADGMRFSGPDIRGDVHGGRGAGSNIAFYVHGGTLGDLNLSKQYMLITAISHGTASNEIGLKLDKPGSNLGTIESGDGGVINLVARGSETVSVATPTGGSNHGVHLAGAAFKLGQSGSARVNFSARGGEGTDSCHGVCVDTAAVTLTIANGKGGLYFSDCYGGNASGSGNHGVHLEQNMVTNQGFLSFSSIGGGRGSANNHGVFIGSGAQVLAPLLTFDSISSGQGSGSDIGFYVAGGTVGSSSVDLDLTIGSASSSGGSGGVGCQVDQGGKILTGSGSGRIQIDASGSSIGPSSHGVVITGSGSSVTAANNSLVINGLGPQGHGIQIAASATVGTTGTGRVLLNGSSGGGGVTHGVLISGPTTSVSSAEGPMTIYGSTNSAASTAAGITITSSTDPFTVSGTKGLTLKSQKILLDKTKVIAGNGIVTISGTLVTNP